MPIEINAYMRMELGFLIFNCRKKTISWSKIHRIKTLLVSCPIISVLKLATLNLSLIIKKSMIYPNISNSHIISSSNIDLDIYQWTLCTYNSSTSLPNKRFSCCVRFHLFFPKKMSGKNIFIFVCHQAIWRSFVIVIDISIYPKVWRAINRYSSKW